MNTSFYIVHHYLEDQNFVIGASTISKIRTFHENQINKGFRFAFSTGNLVTVGDTRTWRKFIRILHPYGLNQAFERASHCIVNTGAFLLVRPRVKSRRSKEQ